MAVDHRNQAKKLLVIDDEASVREAVTDILELIDVGTLAAPNGEAGVALFQAHREVVGGVLLDLKMPGMGGDATLAALRAIDPAVRVILSSGYHEREVTRQFAGQGVTAFLQKPYDIDALLEKVRQIMDLEPSGGADR